jgi:hypothetical protein
VKKSKNAAAAWEMEWKDESFVIPLPEDEETLCLLIYSHDGIGGDQLLGSFQVSPLHCPTPDSMRHQTPQSHGSDWRMRNFSNTRQVSNETHGAMVPKRLRTRLSHSALARLDTGGWCRAARSRRGPSAAVPRLSGYQSTASCAVVCSSFLLASS